ncbi:hypothetical protein LEAN103870_12835 [Legionella anisa]|uniref:Uncharacterized protein n=1 Tax=Legionella anisa TaxID=28082 RepID=A0AAX0WW06_9GAMM|nr:hypothetical protein [Legionella anisa]AWN72372.1 hypothetical protein DLD14_00045 [Legionella anisa]KTC69089.1 hypothetical protein Lani_2817 [Legionella anisa]MCW8423126.1 hypothetical protein [Legionella anisa]MCW8447786.1 hypothetical protein [Legionella anisa]PNL62822.1 hypothetical protein A6J39_017335 [Legionella anisa]
MGHRKHIKLFETQSNGFFKIILITILSFMGLNAYANIESYHIKYHKDSKVKSVSLSNTELLIEFHRYGNSIGRLLTKTNDAQNIKIDNIYGKNLVIHVLYINKDGSRIRCWGVSKPKTNTIEIQCDKVVSLKKIEEAKPSGSLNGE